MLGSASPACLGEGQDSLGAGIGSTGWEKRMSELLCARCLVELLPGGGDFYRIHIEAVADPSPPGDDDVSANELRERIVDLLQQLNHVSEREAMDQVCRR